MKPARLLLWILILGGAAYAFKRYGESPEAFVARLQGGDAPAASPAPGARPAAVTPATVASALPDAPKKAPHRVLFIGNSLTFTWSMPQMLVELARAGGFNLEVQQHTPGGSRFVQHASNPDVHRLLDGGRWNAVVLQEQSQWPAFADAQVRAEVDPHARSLADRARASSPSAKIVFYMTPARKFGDHSNAASIPELATYDGMQNRINATYRRLSSQLGGTTAPVGEAWRAIRTQRPDLELYGDETHPSKIGAYLIACVFYATLFDRNPEGLAYDPGLDPATRALLQQVAWAAYRNEP